MHTFDLAPFPSFLHSGKATNRRPCSRLLLRTVFDQIKTSFLMPKNGLKICPFLLFGMPSIASRLHISAMILPWETEMDAKSTCWELKERVPE